MDVLAALADAPAERMGPEAIRLIRVACGAVAVLLVKRENSSEPARDSFAEAGESWITGGAVILPVTAGDRLWGRLYFQWSEPARFDEPGRTFLLAAKALIQNALAAAGASQALEEERNRVAEVLESYRQLFDHNPLPSWVYDVDTLQFIAVNEAARRHYGYSQAEFERMTIADIRPPEEIAKLRHHVAHMRAKGQRSGPWVHSRRDGSLILVEIMSHTLDLVGRNARLVVVNDITERDRAERQLRAQEERWQLALRGNNDGLWDYDIPNNRVYYSRRWKEMLGYTEEELPNTTAEWESRVHPDDLPGVLDKLNSHLSRKALFYVAEYRMRCKDGGYKWVLARGQAVWDESGQPVRMVGSHTDVTERKESEQQLARDALYDSLTGVMNRRYVMEELSRAVSKSAELGTQLAIAIGDLDHFKAINDTHGHAGGDEALSVFGQIVQQALRQGDVAGRLGGDEFCIVFPRASLQEATLLVERARDRIATMALGVASGLPFSVTVTFGVAALSAGMTAKQLLHAADTALYRAKQLGRNCTIGA